MVLSRGNVLHYLAARSWIDADAVMSGDAVVIERRLRHTSFTVEHRDGSGVFVKQLHDPHPTAAASLRREARLYQAVAAGRLAGLAPVVPALVGHDRREQVLAVDRFDGVSAVERAVAGRLPSRHEAAAIGRALAAVHGVDLAAARAALDGVIEEALPWAFHLPRYVAGNPSAIPGAGVELAGVLYQHPQLPPMLESLASWWRRQTLIHGDLKWENVLLAAGEPAAAGVVRLIDWELADVGDPAWDAATWLQAPLVRACLTRRWPHPLGPEDVRSQHPAMQAFWQAWRATRPADADGAADGTRTAAYAATRLVYSAYEHAVLVPRLTPAIHAMVATAWNMLCDGRYAAALLGLSP